MYIKSVLTLSDNKISNKIKKKYFVKQSIGLLGLS